MFSNISALLAILIESDALTTVEITECVRIVTRKRFIFCLVFIGATLLQNAGRAYAYFCHINANMSKRLNGSSSSV